MLWEVSRVNCGFRAGYHHFFLLDASFEFFSLIKLVCVVLCKSYKYCHLSMFWFCSAGL